LKGKKRDADIKIRISESLKRRNYQKNIN